MFAIWLMIFHVPKECGMRRIEFNKKQAHYDHLWCVNLLLGFAWDLEHKNQVWQILFYKMLTGTDIDISQNFHRQLILLHPDISWSPQLAVWSSGSPRDLRMQLQVERLQSIWPSLPKVDPKVVGSYEGDHARSDCYLVEVGVSVFNVFFPHILDVKLFLLFEVLERSNAKNSNMITVPVLDVGNQKSLFVLVFLVMPSWDSVTQCSFFWDFSSGWFGFKVKNSSIEVLL